MARWTGCVLLLVASGTALSGCSRRPPPDFRPDPGLVERIREIHINPALSAVCPGEVIPTHYQAVLDDGTVLPFERRYDRRNPPALHVVFLGRSSREAVSQEDGDWVTDPDPLLSVMTGFRLSVFLRAKPSINAFKVVAPEYSCLRNAFVFVGPPGDPGQPGGDGPDITVRIGVLGSPFYERLVVAAIEVGSAPPFFVLAPADEVPRADWLVVESRGGRGGRGQDGSPGTAGANGSPGCPGSAGAPGGAGGNGGAGAPGGRGGRITIIGPEEEPFLAGLVDGRSIGGPGGPGGRGGKGGPGGKGGEARAADPNRRCEAGSDGPNGPDGRPGPDGPPGSPGPAPQIITVPLRQVFASPRMPPPIAELLEYSERAR
ncbi:hypothetical protein HRbin33_01730 [bacterium HR33]|nr:hypothetical protein HRbin33_01730 [bacterium HR33]